MSTRDASGEDRLELPYAIRDALLDYRRAQYEYGFSVGAGKRDGDGPDAASWYRRLEHTIAAALSQARAVPDEVLRGLQQALLACENEANPGKRHKDYETVRKTLDAMLAAAPEPPVSPPPAREVLDLAEVERLFQEAVTAALRYGACWPEAPSRFRLLQISEKADADCLAAIRQIATPDTEGRVAINDAMSDLKLHDPADEEAAEWVIRNLHGLRRDDGSIEYTLKAVIRAFQAGKATSPPPPADEAAKPLDPVAVRDGALAGIRAAKMAMFLIDKHGTTINDSWRSGIEKDIETAQKALKSPADLPAAAGKADDGWQPIETAPIDEEVLLFCPDRGMANKARIELDVAHSSRGSHHSWSTHWHPLPQLPADLPAGDAPADGARS